MSDENEDLENEDLENEYLYADLSGDDLTALDLWQYAAMFTQKEIGLNTDNLQKLRKLTTNRSIRAGRKLKALMANQVNINSNIESFIDTLERISDSFTEIIPPKNISHSELKTMNYLIETPNIEISTRLRTIGDTINIARDNILKG